MVKIAVIGGGPSGIFCALKLLEFLRDRADITVFEKSKPLQTLLPTGNGRCNLSYLEYDYKELASNFPRGEKFLYSVFSRYGIGDTLDDFEKIGVKTYVQEDLRIFPEENKASFVRKKLLEALNGKIKFVNTEIKNFPQGFDAVILATGLKSGALLPQSIGHKIIPLKSSLCGLKIKEKEFLTLEGVSFNGVVFTKDGVSGPFIYKLSSINAYKEFPYEIKIPLLDTKELFKKTGENPKKLFKNVVSEFIPKSLADLIVKSDKQCANTSKKEIEELSFLTLTAEDIDGRGEIVHAGGVSLDEVDRNLKSKIKENLWIIGEVLDTDGFTGGFNLQNCWSTAAIAAKDIAEKFKG